MPNGLMELPGPLGAWPTFHLRGSTIDEDPRDTALDNPAARQIAQDVLAATRLALTSAIVEPEATAAGSPERLLVELLDEPRYRARRDQIVQRAQAILAAPDDAKAIHFGRYHRIEPREAARGADRLLERVDPPKIDFKYFGVKSPRLDLPADLLRVEGDRLVIPPEVVAPRDLDTRFRTAVSDAVGDELIDLRRIETWLGPLRRDDEPAELPEPEDVEPQQVTDKLRVWVRRVTCIDETNPEWWGDDEIALAGLSIDETGDVKRIAERYVGSGFHDGVSRTLNWNWHWFSLREGTVWPKWYRIVLILAEKDAGGLSAFVQRLWERVRDHVRTFIERAAQAAGLAIGQLLGIPELAWLIARVISAIVWWVVRGLVDWLIRLFADDIFPPCLGVVRLRSYYDRFWQGRRWSRFSRVRRCVVSGHGGRYAIDYQWEIFA